MSVCRESVNFIGMDVQDIMLLLDTPLYIRRKREERKREKKRKYWVHPILQERTHLGEFHHLHNKLREDSDKFFEYYRMSAETFHYILDGICPSISKWSNFREVVSPEERLAVTLR